MVVCTPLRLLKSSITILLLAGYRQR
jgi:hypothetical protein